jgi:predicted nuclease with TOPRIM domain
VSEETEVQAVEPVGETAEQIKAERDALKLHHEKLLGETKTAKQKAAELEAAQSKAEEERQKEKGEFKSLYEKTQAELEVERTARREDSVKRRELDVSSNALTIAADIGVDAGSVKLLKQEIAAHSVYSDGQITYELAGITVSKEKIVEHLSGEYPRLVKGNQSSGGSAIGGKQGGSAAKGDFGGSRSERQAAIAKRFNLN